MKSLFRMLINLLASRASSQFREGRHPSRRRQLATALLALVLVGCASDDAPQGIEGTVKGFIGGVSVDEPRAALAGRRILASGGSAADAATAIYFTLAVTYPSAASLGGGGVCLVYDSAENKVGTLNFMPARPSSIPGNASLAVAVPGNPVGFFTLHSRFGRLRWETIVAGAEQLARFGTQTSRALAVDLNLAQDRLIQDSETWSIFAGPDRQASKEGQFLRQLDLAGILSSLRARGPGDFYRGPLAGIVEDAAKSSGASLTRQDLNAYRPFWSASVEIVADSHFVHFSDNPAASRASALMFAVLSNDDLFADTAEQPRAHLLAEVEAMAGQAVFANPAAPRLAGGKTPQRISPAAVDEIADRYRSTRHQSQSSSFGLPPAVGSASSSTGFAVVDKDSFAVACSLTMNAPFGVGRVARGTGMFLAAAPGIGPNSGPPVAAAIGVNTRSKQFFFAGASGGVSSTIGVLPSVVARTMLAEQSLRSALDFRRVGRLGEGDVTYVEDGLPPATRASLSERGHNITGHPTLGRVNAVYCSAGLPRDPATCAVGSDPRGHGLALTAEE